MNKLYRKYIKRMLDVFFSVFSLSILTPLLLLIALVVRIKLGSPVIFKHERPGLHEKIFTLYKFRTMTDERDESEMLLPNHERVTNFGRMLRSTSLDELPELVNIIKGDMSFIGPRPLLVEYLPLYDSKQILRHNVTPGITGLAQVEGRNSISWEEKFELDLSYIERLSFYLDMKIVFKTIKSVFFRENINESGNISMSKFTGSSNQEHENG